MKNTCLFVLLLVTVSALQSTLAQITGTVSDDIGDPLPYATVYIDGSTNGVVTNEEGRYELKPERRGEVIVVGQFLGYESEIKTIDYNGSQVDLNFQLETEAVIAPAVEVMADGEDPAYPIIRRAMERRKFHQSKIQSYACDSYIKGRIDIEEMPSSIFGVSVNDMEGYGVDSNGAGIIYLSESESRFYKAPPDKAKEVMYSSKISGRDNMYSFNNAMSLNFSIYDNHIDIVRNIKSPIGAGAMTYYKYELEGTTFDDEGRLLNKIRVIPKSPTSPTFSGIIYVMEDQWSVPLANLVLTGDHVHQSAVDTIRLEYTSLEAEQDTWVDVKKLMWLRIKFLGVKGSGGFRAVFRNFDINPDLDEGFFDNEIFHVKENANKKDSLYWDEIRPVPLTGSEVVNYEKMDSLKLKRRMKRDSLINFPPKYNLNSALSGYDRYHDQGRLQSHWNLYNGMDFNAVQSIAIGSGFDLLTNTDSTHLPQWQIGGELNYSFGDHRLRGSAFYRRESPKRNGFNWAVEAGRKVEQFRQAPPINDGFNSLSTMIWGRNYSKFYEKDVLAGEMGWRWLSGFDLRLFGAYAQRRALVNTVDHGIRKKDRIKWSNDPLDPDHDEPSFMENDHFRIGFEMDWNIGQQYITYPNKITRIPSKYPTIHVKALFDANISSGSNIGQWEVGLSDEYDWKIRGDGRWSVKIGGIASERGGSSTHFTDFKHFKGNEIIVGTRETYRDGFLWLPYYEYSISSGSYLEGHLVHHFRGYILDKIPFVRLLKWHLVAGANYLNTSTTIAHYTEGYLSVENIGIQFIRPLRFDTIFRFRDGEYLHTRVMVGLNVPLSGDRKVGKRMIKTSF